MAKTLGDHCYDFVQDSGPIGHSAPVHMAGADRAEGETLRPSRLAAASAIYPDCGACMERAGGGR